ncbi:aquaporin Z [Dietzia massiliensis]|uniref:aquaporin Z n=1 Tax=Dietzia massiliensis TaxID=2697499 RepID=UPI001BCAA7C5|nr:aquaporin Z [Dietzia massiliensis]MBS7547485.1 aquaporin Z [Dietzia massiliensis]
MSDTSPTAPSTPLAPSADAPTTPPATPPISAVIAAEVVGTFWLVLGGCGTAVFAAVQIATADTLDVPVGVGYLGVAIAFGLTVLTGAYAFGHISGAHFNPAVTVGAAVAGRLPWSRTPVYIVSQVVGGLVAGAVILAVASGKDGFEATGRMAANGYGANSPDGYGLLSALLIEIVLTAVFVWVILGSTDRRAPAGFAPAAIGLTLTLIHLISIPITNTSVNPARSTAVAFFNGDGAPGQLWLFWVAPIAGALIAGALYGPLFGERDRSTAR